MKKKKKKSCYMILLELLLHYIYARWGNVVKCQKGMPRGRNR